MSRPFNYLTPVLSLLALVACGGGGGGGDSAPPAPTPAPAISPGTSSALFESPSGGGSTTQLPSGGVSFTPPIPANSTVLSKYAGVWQQACVDHIRLKTTLTVNETSDNFTVTPEETHYSKKDCTGDVVATGSYGGPSETVKYSANLDASIILKDGSTLPTLQAVNPATSSIATATLTLTGSGVKPSINLDGMNYTQIQYADEPVPRLYKERVLNGGTTYGALLLRYENLPNEELLTLIPVAGAPNSFKVNLQFLR